MSSLRYFPFRFRFPSGDLAFTHASECGKYALGTKTDGTAYRLLIEYRRDDARCSFVSVSPQSWPEPNWVVS